MSYQGEVLADAPLFYWVFDGSDTAIDATGNGRDGTIIAPNFTANMRGYWAGDGDRLALRFNGETYINIKDIGGLIGTDSFTVEFVYPTAPSVDTVNRAKWGFHTDAGDNFLNYWDPNVANQWNLPNLATGDSKNTVGNYITPGAYQHVVVIYDRDAGALRYFIDGSEIEDGTYPLVADTPAVPSDMQFTVGMEWDGTTPSDFSNGGSIDAIAVYKGKLSPERIAFHYQASYAPAANKVISGEARGWNPSAVPLPNPTAIGNNGHSSVIRRETGLLATFDMVDGCGGSASPSGTVPDPARQGRITGTVTDENGEPIQRRVRCHDRATGRIVRETWSDAAGYYQFDDLDTRKPFTIIAMDYAGEYNAVVADWVRSEVPT